MVAATRGAVQAMGREPPPVPDDFPLDYDPEKAEQMEALGDSVQPFTRGDHVEIAEAVIRGLGPHPVTYASGEVWTYKPAVGIWEAVAGPRLRVMAAGLAGSPVGMKGKPLLVSAQAMAGAEKVAADLLTVRPDRVTFDDAPNGLAFANGFAVVRDGRIEMVPHSPANKARHAYDFPLDVDAPTPLLDRFLADIFADCDAVERDLRIALLQEFVGACLIGEAPKYQRCLVLYATGGNGKSEILRIFRGLFPADSVTSLVPQWWSNQFRAVMLENKLANFCDEMPDAEIMGGEAWKLVVTGEPIPAERKFKDGFIFRCRAGHIFATNTPIRTTDHSDGFWRRPLILMLTRRFDLEPDRKLEAGQKVLDAERAAIVAWALHGAARAQAQGGYTVPPSSGSIVREWRDENDQVRGFIAENPITGRVAASVLYSQYQEWARANGNAPMSSTMFGRRLMGAGLASRVTAQARRFYEPPVA